LTRSVPISAQNLDYSPHAQACPRCEETAVGPTAPQLPQARETSTEGILRTDVGRITTFWALQGSSEARKALTTQIDRVAGQEGALLAAEPSAWSSPACPAPSRPKPSVLGVQQLVGTDPACQASLRSFPGCILLGCRRIQSVSKALRAA